MAHYAFIGYDNKVVKVIVGVDEDVTQLDGDIEVGGSSEAWEQFYESQEWNAGLTCKRTSYNGNIRKQYAGIGFTYNGYADVFVQPQPYPSWTLDSNYDWQPPTPKPEGNYAWFEPNQVWIEIDEP
jgi:hypothetical protein